jgi:3-methylcrotonyl-CoA carboxylase alpha subunit
MEMNTRLQVEHPVTEAITGLDLVEWQLRVASGEPLPRDQDEIAICGHAFEARLYAEDPANDFLPQTGTLAHLDFGDARIDTGVRSGDAISPFYDPMIAKLITHSGSREQALGRLQRALAETHVAGTTTNRAFLLALASHDGFAAGELDTGLIDRDVDALTAKPETSDMAVALAAIAALDLDPADPRLGWRLWGEASHQVRLLQGDTMIGRRLILHGHGSVTLEGETPFRLDNLVRDTTTIGGNSGSRGFAAGLVRYQTAGATHVSVLLGGASHDFTVPDPLTAGADIAGSGDAVTAPMTGIVRLIDVDVGQAVSAGDRLAVVEAMKMEHPLTAPRDGTIAAIHGEPGSAVEGGAVLIALEPDED